MRLLLQRLDWMKATEFAFLGTLIVVLTIMVFQFATTASGGCGGA